MFYRCTLLPYSWKNLKMEAANSSEMRVTTCYYNPEDYRSKTSNPLHPPQSTYLQDLTISLLTRAGIAQSVQWQATGLSLNPGRGKTMSRLAPALYPMGNEHNFSRGTVPGSVKLHLVPPSCSSTLPCIHGIVVSFLIIRTISRHHISAHSIKWITEKLKISVH
jgi:hypothetical protein